MYILLIIISIACILIAFIHYKHNREGLAIFYMLLSLFLIGTTMHDWGVEDGVYTEKKAIIQLSKDCKVGDYLYIDGTQTYPCQKTVNNDDDIFTENIYQWKKSYCENIKVGHGQIQMTNHATHGIVFDCNEGYIIDSDTYSPITIPVATTSKFFK